MQRAMRDDQKQIRHQAILDVAWELFQQMPYEAVNMQEVAARAGLAKGTLYLYAKTKEELFLAILMQHFTEWFDTVDGLLPTVAGIAGVTTVLTETLTSRPALVRLFAIVHVVLEKNIPYAAALSFKQLLQQRLLHTGQLVESHLPFLQAGEGAQFLLRAYALTIGLQHLADPAPIIQQVLDDHGMAVFQVNFAAEFSAAVQALLRGWTTQQE